MGKESVAVASDTATVVRAARAAVATLEAEQSTIADGITSASGDGARWLTLRRRGDDLPVLLQAARIQLCQAEIAQLQAQLPAAKAEATTAAEHSEALWQAAHAARQVAEEAFGAAGNLDSYARGLQITLSERQRHLAELMATAMTPPGPVVRSRWQS